MVGDDVWLASHVRLWVAARVARRWLQGFRVRAAGRLRDSHAGVLGMLAAGLSAHELGDELAAEAGVAAAAVAAADGAVERSRSLLRDAGRRVGVLVCGMFCRLQGKGKGRGPGRGAGGGKLQGKRRQCEPPLIELRGAERQAYISRTLEAVSAAEGGGSSDWAFGHGLVAQYHNPVPYWSWRPLCPGEWREGTGVNGEGPLAKRRRLLSVGGHSKGDRMRVLAEASGSFGTLLNLGWGRYIGPRPVLPGRVEDTSGVT